MPKTKNNSACHEDSPEVETQLNYLAEILVSAFLEQKCTESNHKGKICDNCQDFNLF